jgi:AcrR family transcriptional regulator
VDRPLAARPAGAPVTGVPAAPVPPAAPAAPAETAAPPTPRFQEKREAILAAAAAAFNERGVKGATLADIAAAVGLVTNSVTYYYRKKEDLATACFERAIAAFDALALRAAQQRSVAARVATFFQLHAALLAAIDRNEAPPLVAFSDMRALPSPQVARVFAAYTDMFRRVRELLKGPETTALSRDDLNARAHILLSVAHWVRTWIPRHEAEAYPRAAARVADVLLHGLAAPASHWPERASGDGASAALHDAQADAGGPGEAFLRAATALVNEQGYRGASVDRISARLNVTKGSFYHHHDTKHDLITACFERSFAIMRRALARAEQTPGSGWQRCCDLARALVCHQLGAHGPLLRITATSALPDQAHRQRVRDTLNRLNERLASLVVDGMCDGSIRPLDPAVAANVLDAAINAAAELQRWVPGATLDNASDLYVRPMLEGLLCPPAPRAEAPTGSPA